MIQIMLNRSQQFIKTTVNVTDGSNYSLHILIFIFNI